MGRKQYIDYKAIWENSLGSIDNVSVERNAIIFNGTISENTHIVSDYFNLPYQSDMIFRLSDYGGINSMRIIWNHEGFNGYYNWVNIGESDNFTSTSILTEEKIYQIEAYLKSGTYNNIHFYPEIISQNTNSHVVKITDESLTKIADSIRKSGVYDEKMTPIDMPLLISSIRRDIGNFNGGGVILIANINDETNMNSYKANSTDTTMFPVCGNRIISMQNSYFNCQYLNGEPVSGVNVNNMYGTYYRCYKITGSPACGPNVTNMGWTYTDCWNLTGSPVCGPNVIYMAGAYSGCYNLKGSPACGQNVEKMESAYNGCENLTGSPVCGPNVTDMIGAYSGCYKLTGSPVCGNNVVLMQNAYYFCLNLTGSPACGPNVFRFDWTYRNCRKLTGSPACSNNVATMEYTYTDCWNLTGSPVCGPRVTSMEHTYENCGNLDGKPVCGQNVKYMSSTYRGCYKLKGSPAISNNLGTMDFAYCDCVNIQNIKIGPNVYNLYYAFADIYRMDPIIKHRVCDLTDVNLQRAVNITGMLARPFSNVGYTTNNIRTYNVLVNKFSNNITNQLVYMHNINQQIVQSYTVSPVTKFSGLVNYYLYLNNRNIYYEYMYDSYITIKANIKVATGTLINHPIANIKLNCEKIKEVIYE